jgi:predicted dehydrogenase/threonine dehydrogenase-like Zn-dependent dehydrogenase
MKQILQRPRTGEISVSDVPAPQLVPGCVLVRIAASLVSVGTERASSEFASKNLLQKAKARPDLVREVVGKIRRDGLFSAVQAVRSRLDQPLALGYSSAGRVVGIGEGVTDIRVGDRVACAGTGYAVHAEVACVPRLLVAKLPEPSPITFDEAAFATLGSVALHGIRTADVKLGDTVAVIGLGLLGQLTVQILKAGGCRVLGMDIASNRAELASRLGADATAALSSEFRDLCYARSRGAGVDAVLITAETPSSDPVNLAAEIARDRGIVVAVGMVGMDIERRLYYEKELDFRISRSYGPGRYDAAYEQKGHDYPIGYVRWTETRNMEEFLELLTDGKLDLKSLITHRFPIDRAHGAYDLITGRTGEQFLGVLITYPEQPDQSQILELVEKGRGSRAIKPVAIGLLGAGSFAVSTLLPATKQVSGVEFVGVCNATGVRGCHAAEKFGFQYCTTDEKEILNDARINTVLIATRHHLHARQVVAALNAGKHVFCEKPLCLSEEELADVVRSYTRSTTTQQPVLMVGFNRRFAPMALRMKAFLSEVKEPLAMHYRVNAGYLPPDHWVHDPEQGGGRILGEVCHFVDFLMFLASSSPVEVQASSLANPGQYSGDNVVVSLRFANGSQGTIGYLANGDKSFSKERVEVFGGGAVAVLEDFRRLELVRHGKKQTMRARWRQDKGHRGECEALANAIRTGQAVPIPFDQIVGATLATLRIQDSLALGRSMSADVAAFVGSVLNSTITNE